MANKIDGSVLMLIQAYAELLPNIFLQKPNHTISILIQIKLNFGEIRDILFQVCIYFYTFSCSI